MKMNFARIMRGLATRYAGRLALVNVERNRRYTYAEFHALTNRVANALASALGIAAGDRFLLILDNDNLSLLHVPTAIKQAGTLVLTNIRDSFEEHAWQVSHVRPKVVFIESRMLDAYYEMLRRMDCRIVIMDPVDHLPPGVDLFWTLVEHASASDPDLVLDTNEHLFMLRFTGGTTGQGKCAMYSIDNVLACVDGALACNDLALDESTRMLHVSSLSHGTMMLFNPIVFCGGTNLTLNQIDLQRWREIVECERVSHAFLVPTILYRVLEMQRSTPLQLASLRTIVYGAAPMNPTKLADLVKCFGPVFVQAYAATETAMLISVLGKSEHRSDSEQGRKRLSSAGQVMPGVEVFVADAEGRSLPSGEIGEIRIRCRATIKGYYGNPELSASDFDADAWKSGDLGYLDDDGFLYIVDRLKDMVITGGFNVYAIEVEGALASHPAVFMAAVVGVPHPEWGESIHAEVILRPGLAAGDRELIDHVKSLLATYKAPKTITFVDELPLSVVGKVLRRKVRQKYWGEADRRVG